MGCPTGGGNGPAHQTCPAGLVARRNGGRRAGQRRWLRLRRADRGRAGSDCPPRADGHRGRRRPRPPGDLDARLGDRGHRRLARRRGAPDDHGTGHTRGRLRPARLPPPAGRCAGGRPGDRASRPGAHEGDARGGRAPELPGPARRPRRTVPRHRPSRGRRDGRRHADAHGHAGAHLRLPAVTRERRAVGRRAVRPSRARVRLLAPRRQRPRQGALPPHARRAVRRGASPAGHQRPLAGAAGGHGRPGAARLPKCGVPRRARA